MALGLDALAGGKRLLRALAGATVGAALCDRSFTELSVSLGGAMVRMIVHVGAHRTATSFVQGTLLKNAKKLGGVGVGYRSIGGAAKPLRILRDSDDEQDIRIAAEAFCDRFRTSHPAALVSWEGLLGMPFVNGVLYGGRGPYLKMLQRAAELISSELEIILTIRRQDDFINSWYAQIVKRGATITAEQYLAEIDFACLDWMPVVEDFRRIFNHVSIIPYEKSLENDIGYLQEFLNTAGIPVDATKLDLDQGKQNASDTAEALEIILFTNRYAKFEQIEDRDTFRKLVMGKLGNGTPASVLDPLARRNIADRYRSQNLALLNELSVSMETLKYYSLDSPSIESRS